MTNVITYEQGHGGHSPELVRIVTQATLAQVTMPGWYNNSVNFGERISPVDQAQICYSYGTPLQYTAIFNVAVNPQAIVTFSLAETNVIFGASVILNQAAVLGMYAAPFQIVAPIPNHVIIPVQATIYTNFQTTAFAGGGVGILQYNNAIHGAGTNALSATIPAAEITAAASQIYSLPGNTANALTGITNAGLFLSNQTAAFTGGNAASTVTMNVSYYVVPALV